MLWLLYIRRLAVGFYDSCIVLHNLSVSVEEDRDVLGISKQIIIFGIFPFVPKHVETGELIGSPRMAITSCLVIPRSTFLFPLAEAERHTANINMVVAMSAITSFLFISDTVFISYYIVLWLQKYSFLLK